MKKLFILFIAAISFIGFSCNKETKRDICVPFSSAAKATSIAKFPTEGKSPCAERMVIGWRKPLCA